MKRHIVPTVLVLFALAAGPAFSNTVSFKLSYFVPSMGYVNASDSFWKTEFDNMSFTKTNFQDSSFGFAYEYFLTREFSLIFGIDTYSKNKAGSYKDYVGYTIDNEDWAFPNDYQGDFMPGHSLNISITPIQVSLKVAPLGRRVKLIPYFGAGAGLYIWSLRMQGDMIDFSQPATYDDPQYGPIPVYPIYPVNAIEGENFGKIAFGYQVFGGVQFPIGNRLTLEAEFKYNHAKASLGDAFQGFEPLDIGGFQISLGLNYWF
jgi:opacity protein-like surface antigen